jgi:hypothetical protein
MGDEMLHEFRNHLMLLLAGTTEIRATIPRTVAVDLAETLDEMDATLQTLTFLATSLTAALEPGEQMISDVGDVIHRALAIAAPSTPSRVRTMVTSRPAAIRNRGRVVECALASVITDLYRAPEFRNEKTGNANEIGIQVHPERGALTIEIESSASQRPVPSWRTALAQRLVASADGSLTLHPEKVGFLFRFE